MEKRFIFVNISIESGYNSGVNHGIAYLTPILKRHSYEVTCLNIRLDISEKNFIDKIEDFKPSIVGFSCTSHQLKYLVKYSKGLEGYPQILQIAGGVGPTLDPEWVLNRSGVHGVCIGEGDIPLNNLLNNIDNKQDVFDTEGFYWRINGRIKKNDVSPFVSDLSTLDFPDYTIFERKVVAWGDNLFIMLSRGCPFDCYYCCNRALSERYSDSNKYFRLPSVQHSIRLLEGLLEQHPETKFITFEDDLLIANKAWFEGFAEEFNKRIGLPYRICARPEYINPGIVAALKSSGCKWVFIGLESGNEYLRGHFLNRKYTNRVFIEKSMMIKNAEIYLFTFNIVGFPYETKEQMEDTFQLNREIGPNHGVCTFFYPYKHTALYKICEENNLLKSEDEMLQITNYNTKPSIKMSAEQERDCIYFQKKIKRYLDKQGYLTKMANLPFGITKCFVSIFYYVNSYLYSTPLLKRILWRVFQLSGINNMVSRLVGRLK